MRTFNVPPGVFGGVIGGPPCQTFSTASQIAGTKKQDLIPEFLRIVEQAQPEWVVMENVPQAIGHSAIPRQWNVTKLRDYDCGGATSRTRAFWTHPFMLLVPPFAGGDAEHSVMASTWKRGSSQYVKDKGFLPGDLSIMDYAKLQGCEDTGKRLVEHKFSKPSAVHMLGNGVPVPMGRFIARAVTQYLNLK